MNLTTKNIVMSRLLEILGFPDLYFWQLLLSKRDTEVKNEPQKREIFLDTPKCGLVSREFERAHLQLFKINLSMTFLGQM